MKKISTTPKNRAYYYFMLYYFDIIRGSKHKVLQKGQV